MRPSFSISVPDDSRVSWVSFSRSRIISSTASLGVCSRSPETMRASLGSATRHIILNRMMKRTTAPTTTPAMNPADMAASLEAKASHAGDDHRARREVLHDNDAAPDGDRLVVVGGVGVEGLAPPTHLHHHFTQLAGGDRPGDPTHLPDHLVVGHCSRLLLVRISDPHHPVLRFPAGGADPISPPGAPIRPFVTIRALWAVPRRRAARP